MRPILVRGGCEREGSAREGEDGSVAWTPLTRRPGCNGRGWVSATAAAEAGGEYVNKSGESTCCCPSEAELGRGRSCGREGNENDEAEEAEGLPYDSRLALLRNDGPIQLNQLLLDRSSGAAERNEEGEDIGGGEVREITPLLSGSSWAGQDGGGTVEEGDHNVGRVGTVRNSSNVCWINRLVESCSSGLVLL